MPEGHRRLAAIMFTDMVGYTALGQRNESLSLALVEEQRKLVRPILARHGGREVKTIGDAFLVEFPNALDAVSCAYDIQRATREFNIPLAPDRRVHLRVGLHLGDVVESQGDISGDAVNVASRIEPLAEDGGVCLTRQVYDHVANKLELKMKSLGQKALKNVSESLEVYQMIMPWEQDAKRGEDVLPRDRVAILPFANMSPDPNDSYFADGITDEIITTVSGISGLSVISRTSVMGYKGTTKKVGEIGRELDVGSILEGSFKKAGNRIRVTTQLIDVAQDKHLWAQNYDRNLDDVFEVQSDVAKQVADALRVKILSPELKRIERLPTDNTAAYSLYLRGRSHWSRRGLDDLKKAAEYFELAVHEDATFAPGYVGQADCAMLLCNNWQIDRDENHSKAKLLSERALELDPNLAEAHATKGLVLSYDYDFPAAEEEFKKAIELNPSNASAHMWYYQILLAQMRWGEAKEQINKTLELDPMSGVAHLNKGVYYFARREFDKALGPFKVAALELGFTPAYGMLTAAYGKLAMFDEMESAASSFVKAFQDVYPYIGTTAQAWGAYFRGDKGALTRLLPELQAHLTQSAASAYMVASFHFFLGDKDQGFLWLERSLTDRDYDLQGIKSDWDMDGIRTDPRYLGLLKRLRLGN